MAAHSKIGASSMYRWQACPGSVCLSADIPSVSSPYAEGGTTAHDIAANILEGRKPKIPAGFDEENIAAVQTYVNEVISRSSEAAHFYIEHRFDLTSLYPGMFGTADAVLYFDTNKRLTVIDYKHGAGIPVEVVEDGKPNLQLTYYALGAAWSFKFPVSEIEIVIIQPRCPHADGAIRSVTFPATYLLDFAAELVEAAKRTEDPAAPLISGAHCRFCPAAGVCPELHKKALVAAKQEFAPAFSYDPQKLSETLEMLPTIEAWAKSVREFAYREAEHGRIPPGWKLVSKRATRKWVSEESVPGRARERGMREDFCYDKVTKSVAQLEKVFGKKEFEKHFRDLVIQESSGYTLAHESDKREAVRKDAATAFIEADFKELT